MLEEAAVANYRGHTGYMLCVDWSPDDPDAIWTGGKDFTVQEWSVSKQEFTKPPKGSYLPDCQNVQEHHLHVYLPDAQPCYHLREEDGHASRQEKGQFQAEEKKQICVWVWRRRDAKDERRTNHGREAVG